MKILPERVFVLADAEKREVTVVMEGFRLTMSVEEAQALRDGLAQGLRQLTPDQAGSRSAAAIIGLHASAAVEANRP